MQISWNVSCKTKAVAGYKFLDELPQGFPPRHITNATNSGISQHLNHAAVTKMAACNP
jgi:hypothetical protein